MASKTVIKGVAAAAIGAAMLWGALHSGRGGYHGVANGAANASTPSDGKTMVMSKFTIPDPAIGCDAINMLIPKGWTCDAHMYWKENAFFPVSAAVDLAEPNGARRIALFPQGLYADGVRDFCAQQAAIAGPEAMQLAASPYPDGSNFQGAIVSKRMTPAEYLQNFVIAKVRKDLANAQASDPVDQPELAKLKLKNYSSYQGAEAQTTKVRYNYTENGTTMDEDIYVTIYSMPMAGTPIVFWNADVEIYRAEHGQLDQNMGLFIAILNSMHQTLPWFNGVVQVSKMMQANNQQNIANAGKLSQIYTQVNNDISNDIRSAYEAKQKSDDITIREIDQTIRGVDLYGDGEHRYEVPIGYDHYYKNDQGDILMTSDPHFDPNPDGWKELEHSPER